MTDFLSIEKTDSFAPIDFNKKLKEKKDTNAIQSLLGNGFAMKKSRIKSLVPKYMQDKLVS